MEKYNFKHDLYLHLSLVNKINFELFKPYYQNKTEKLLDSTNQINYLRKELDNQKSKYESLTNENNKSKQEANELKTQIKKINKEIEKLEKHLKLCRKYKDTLKKEIEQKENKLSELHDKFLNEEHKATLARFDMNRVSGEGMNLMKNYKECKYHPTAPVKEDEEYIIKTSDNILDPVLDFQKIFPN